MHINKSIALVFIKEDPLTWLMNTLKLRPRKMCATLYRTYHYFIFTLFGESCPLLYHVQVHQLICLNSESLAW